MGNNLIPYSIAIGEKNFYFLTPDFEFIKKENIKNIKLLEKKMKILLICLIIVIQIVEKTRLKN